MAPVKAQAPRTAPATRTLNAPSGVGRPRGSPAPQASGCVVYVRLKYPFTQPNFLSKKKHEQFLIFGRLVLSEHFNEKKMRLLLTQQKTKTNHW